MANKYMVKYSTPLIIEKMQIKNSTLCSLGWLVIKKKEKNTWNNTDNAFEETKCFIILQGGRKE